jgi:alkylhydroperoxidase/carboxymuconolactone decarboxylase family protein YurZ
MLWAVLGKTSVDSYTNLVIMQLMERNPMEILVREAPCTAAALDAIVDAIKTDSGLDPRTAQLINIGIQTANRNCRGVHFHAIMARHAGATRTEVIGAVVMNLHLSGLGPVLDSLGQALEGFDGEGPGSEP